MLKIAGKRLAGLLSCILLGLLAPAPPAQAKDDCTSEAAVKTGRSCMLFSAWDGPAMRVWLYVPKEARRATAPIVFVMHGVRRDADRYREEWIEEADRRGFIVVAPEFAQKDFPRAAGYNLGGVIDAKTGDPRQQAVWSFTAIEGIFDAVVARLDSKQTGYTLYGHSAGSQFIHRYLFFKPQARVKRYLAANAGWYTFPDLAVPYPFGLDGTPVGEERLRAALAKDVVILLGNRDTDRNGSSLNRSKGAMKQGPHRFARGRAFFEAARSLAEEEGWEFGWSLKVVDGVAHSNGGMAPAAAELVE